VKNWISLSLFFGSIKFLYGICIRNNFPDSFGANRARFQDFDFFCASNCADLKLKSKPGNLILLIGSASKRNKKTHPSKIVL
jgi:hypothetical protein